MPSTATDRFDGAISSQAIKVPCQAVSNANLTLSGEQTVNSVAVTANDRVLVKDQTDTTENGIYNVETGAWKRAPDFDGNRDIVNGTVVILGTALGELVQYQVTSANPIVIGTSAITFSIVSNPNITYPVTAAETAAGITPTNLEYESGDVRRYGTNTVPGTTVMDTPISNAFAANAGQVIFQDEEYVLNSLVTITNDVVVYGNGALISGDGRLLFQGTQSAAITTLSSATAIGDQTISVASAAGLAVTNLIRIKDPADNSFSPYETPGEAGEMRRIVGISGTTLTLAGRCEDVYPITTGVVDLITPIQVSISNLEITTGESTHNEPLSLQRCADSHLVNVKTSGGKWRAILLTQCFNVRLDNCEGINDATASGFQYGINIDESQNCVVDGGFYYGLRHGATMGGDAMPTRNCIVQNAELSNNSTNSGGADFHSMIANSWYVNCRIHNACKLSGLNCGYSRCHITGNRNDYTLGYLNPSGGVSGYYDCIVDLATGQNFSGIIGDISAGTGSEKQTAASVLEFIGNSITINSNVTRIANHVFQPDATPDIKFIHKNNHIHGTISGLANYMLMTIDENPSQVIIKGIEYDDTKTNIPQTGSIDGTAAESGTRWDIDRREGTWTPTYVMDSTDFDSVTYDAITNGDWRRIGDMVFIEGVIRTDSITIGSASGSAQVGGLPFTVAASTEQGAISIGSAVTFPSTDSPIELVPRASTKQLYLRGRDTVDGSSISLVAADIGTGTNNNHLRFAGWYITSDAP